jgi:hypothetical protein
MDAENVTASRSEARSGNRVTRAFGLKGGAWMRHANPVSVWTRFAVLPLLALSIWSRDWIGWWSLVPIALSIMWLMVNPLFFHEPRSTRNWASKSVLGERIWTDDDHSTFPDGFLDGVPAVTTGFQVVGLAILVYGLVVLDAVATITGIIVTQVAKLWFLDRMVLLFQAMKARNARFAEWEY